MNKKGESTLRIVNQKLNYFRYAENTKKIYLHYIDEFLQSQNKSPIHLNSHDFQKYLDNYKFSSGSKQNQVINAIRFLYKYGLNKKYNKIKFDRPRKEYKLPDILSQEEIKQLINSIINLKHRCIIATIYYFGLRRSECINVRLIINNTNVLNNY